MSIKRIFLILFFILLTAIIISNYTIFVMLKTQLINGLISQYENQEKLISKEIADTFSTHMTHLIHQLQITSNIPDLRSEDKQVCNKSLQNIYSIIQTEIDSLYKVGDDGIIFCATDSQFEGTEADEHDNNFTYIKNDPAHRPMFSHAVIMQNSSQQAIEIQVPIYEESTQSNQTKKFVGTLEAVIDLDGIENRYLQNITFAQQGYVVLLEDTGTILYHPDHALIGKQAQQELFNNTQILSQIRNGSPNGNIHYFVNNTQQIAAYSTFHLPLDKTWVVLVSVPVTDIYKSILDMGFEQLLTKYSFILILIVLLSGILFVGILLRLIFNPIEKITLAVSQAAKGNLSIHIPIRRKDEIGKLAHIFNEMAAELKDTYNNLEVNVKDKTKALRTQLSIVKKEKIQIERQTTQLKRLQLAVDNASDQIIITDIDGIILYANKAGEKITGYTLKEMIGTKAGVIWGKCMEKDYYVRLWKTIKTVKSTFTDEITNKHKNGKTYTAELHISPVSDESNKIQYFVGIERDISKAKEIDRMKTEFISLASHQLRTPLTAVKWFIEMLRHKDLGELTPKQDNAMKIIDESNQRMIALVNSLLNISRIDSGKLVLNISPVSLKMLIQEVIKQLQSQLVMKDQKIIFTAEENLQEVRCDQKMIREVYANIITNAIKYSPVKTEIHIKLYKKDNTIVSRISDQGYGIPKDQKERIFQKFFRADNAIQIDSDGNGLGLYFVKGIIEALKGNIGFESEEGIGTTFWFSLPI
jgi:PAS domain S-box-containing protein